MAKCSCDSDVKAVLPCCGASNVGQIANEAGKRLHVEGSAKFFCIAGGGGHVSGMIASVKGADRVLVVDGCPVGCAKKCMEAAGLSGYEHLVITELGIQKEHEFNIAEGDIEKAVAQCREKLLATAPKQGAGRRCR